MASFLFRLLYTRRRVDEQIERELAKPSPNPIRLLRLRSFELALQAHLARRLSRQAAF